MGGSDPRRAWSCLAGLAALAIVPACFFELPGALERPSDATSSSTGSAGGGGPTGSGGATTSTGGSSSESSGGGGASASSASTGGTGAQGGQGPTWWDEQWTRRVRIDINNTGGDALTDFPVLLTLTPGRIDYASTLDDGADLRFVDADGKTVFAHEIDHWDEAGTSYVWVRVPSVPSMSMAGFFWMYFGNAAATDGQDGPGVWASSYAAVYHLGDDPSGPGGKIKDSTGHLLDAVAVGLASADRVAGFIGGGLHFSGGPRIDLAEDGGALDVPPGEARTFEIWASRDLGSSNMYVMMNEGCCEGTSLWFQGEPTLHASFSPDTGCCQPNNYAFDVAPFPNDTAWRYLAVVWDRTGAGEIRIYLDGQHVSSGAMTQPGASSAQAIMHLASDHQGNNGFQGMLDEARFAKGGLSDATIKAQFRSMKDQLVVYEPVEELPP